MSYSESRCFLDGEEHIPAGGPFQKSPANKGTIDQGSTTVFFDRKGAARMGDPVKTCNDPADAPNGTVIATLCSLVEQTSTLAAFTAAWTRGDAKRHGRFTG